MKKLYLLLVMLCVAVASSADVTATFLANSGNQTVTNGKGFLWNHTAYEINVGQVGDLAAADLSALSDATNPNNKYNMENGTYFVIKGKLNPSDMAAIDSRLGSSVNPVYIDFAQAQFVDAEGNDITDGSLIKNMNNSKVKYVVLPDNTTEINSEGWPATVEEAIAVNQTAGKFFGFATYDKNGNRGAGTLEHLIAFDNRPYKNANVTDYTLTGTYWHQSVKNSLGDYEDVISLMYKSYGYNEFNCKSLNLENATMLSYGEEIERILEVKTDDGRTFTYTYHEDSNALRSITFLMNSIESVKLPTTEGTTLIPYMAFDQCHKITEIEIPGNISYLGTAAFNQCDGITSLTFNKGLTGMGSNCFWKCKSLKSVTLPVGLENIGTYAFVECDALEDVVIPEGVKRLETGCFEQTNIKSVRLPNSLEYIDANAFRQCLNLKTITIPENVKEIGSNAFARCNRITDVYFLGTTTIPKAAADAFESELYYHNQTVNQGNYEEIQIAYPGVVLPDYPEAAVHSTDPVYQRDKVKLTTWATYVDGEKVNGAAVMHYPRVKVEAEYSKTTWNAYQEALAAYEAATDNEEYQTWKEAAEKTYYRDENGVKVEVDENYMREHPEQDYYTDTFVWTQATHGWNDPKYAPYYEKLEDGTYQITENPEFWKNNIYYKEKSYEVADEKYVAAIIAGEPEISVEAPGQLYWKNSEGKYEAYTGTTDPGQEVFYQTKAAVDDLYGEYYTVPNRNKSYGGTYYGDPEDNILNSETWPDRQDMSKFAGTANRREGLPTPDGTPAGTYDGLKNFILAAGYPEEGEEQTPPVQKIDHIKKDVWYTMCFPFDLTDDQLESCFGAGYEVAQFCGVVENDEKTGIILQFTDAVTPDANGVVTKAHVPYMIHPNSMAVNEDGTPKETVFTLTGVKETQKMHDADQKVLMQHAVTQYFNGTPFTFVGYGHNYLPSQVLIPQFAYFLGTKKGETYPRFFRQTGANDRASKSYWNKNIAVVLPGVDKNDASTINFSKIDSRVINSETEGKQVYEVWDYEEGYYNYICNEYKYVPSASASGVKSLANFDLQIVHTPLTETQPEEATAIEAVEKADSFVAADKFGKVYNISGQYVGKDLNNLPKGVYILNGKKYMVK